MSTVYLAVTPRGCEIYHMGVKGMKWGVRKGYETKDGLLTDKGQKYFDTYRKQRNKLTDNYYNSQIKKYDRKYKRTKDPAKKLKYKTLKNLNQDFQEYANAETMEEFDIDDIRREKKARYKNGVKSYAKAAAVTTGIGLGGAAVLTLAGLGNVAVPMAAITATKAVGNSIRANAFIQGYNKVRYRETMPKVSVTKTGPKTAVLTLSVKGRGTTTSNYHLPKDNDEYVKTRRMTV